MAKFVPFLYTSLNKISKFMPLDIAIQVKNIEIIKYLLSKGADLKLLLKQTNKEISDFDTTPEIKSLLTSYLN